MKDKSFAIGSTVAAFLASLCCIGPLLLGGAGLGAVLVATFAPLRPYFLGLSAVLLAGGFYFVYRKPKTAEACAGEACVPQSPGRKLAKSMLWLAAVGVAALAFFPTYGSALLTARKVAAPAASATLQTAELKIAGMDCPVCAGAIQRKLLGTRGVVKADVRYSAGSATVTYDSNQATPADIGLHRGLSAPCRNRASLVDRSAAGAPAADLQRGNRWEDKTRFGPRCC